MAILAKKLKLQKNGSSVVDCDIYTTITEAGDIHAKVKVDDIAGYIAVGTSDNANATCGKVFLKSNTDSSIDYTENSWTTAGTYTWTAPEGVTRVRVALCGGGGGQATAVLGHSGWSLTSDVVGGDGGDSSFGSLISVTGGGGAYISSDMTRTNGAGGIYMGNDGTGGTSNAYKVATTSVGGNGYLLNFDAEESTDGYGTGGGCYFDAHSGDQISSNGAGGGGGYYSGYVMVTSGETYTITVGEAGSSAHVNRGAYSTTVQSNITGNTDGFVLIAYGGDIQPSESDTILSSAKPPYAKLEYTTAGTYSFTVPAGVTTVQLTVAGGGGSSGECTRDYKSSSSGKGSGTDYHYHGGAGGQGGLYTGAVTVISGATYSITVGAGGAAAPRDHSSNGAVGCDGNNGGSSSFGSLATATGGEGGEGGYGSYNAGGSAQDGADGTPTGAGGAGGAKCTLSGNSWSYGHSVAGSDGWVYVEYGGDI